MGSCTDGAQSGSPSPLLVTSEIRNHRLTIPQIRTIFRFSPCRHEGRFAIVTKRGAGCDGRLRRQACFGEPDENADSVRRSRVVLAPRPWRLSAQPCGRCGNGDNQRRSPGRARISRQPIARGRPGCPGCTCWTVCVLLPIAHGARGCRRRPVFPAPSLERAHEIWIAQAKIKP